jgi:AraC family transcriptional regulator
MVRRRLAAGEGWSVSDLVCTSGPRDAPFEEAHELVCIAAVTSGSFQYRTALGNALLSAGSLLLGNAGQCYECRHEHAVGDRCISFQFTRDYFETIHASTPGVHSETFPASSVPPSIRIAPLLGSAEAAYGDDRSTSFEELGVRLAGSVVEMLGDSRQTTDGVTSRDERRVSLALRRIEANGDEPLTLADMAHEVGMSAYHFLRSFRRVVGMTPYQYLLYTRLRRVAVRLRESAEPVATIAFDAGFNDLSTFNRRFRSVMGVSPRAYRAQR